MPNGFHSRSVILNARDYDEALEMLKTTEINSQMYYILSGTEHNQGVVVTRTPLETIDVATLGDDGKWYLVQTNSDRRELTGIYRVSTQNKIEALSKNPTYAEIIEVMSTPSTKLKSTLSTAVISAAGNGKFDTIVWYDGE